MYNRTVQDLFVTERPVSIMNRSDEGWSIRIIDQNLLQSLKFGGLRNKTISLHSESDANNPSIQSVFYMDDMQPPIICINYPIPRSLLIDHESSNAPHSSPNGH